MKHHAIIFCQRILKHSLHTPSSETIHYNSCFTSDQKHSSSFRAVKKASEPLCCVCSRCCSNIYYQKVSLSLSYSERCRENTIPWRRFLKQVLLLCPQLYSTEQTVLLEVTVLSYYKDRFTWLVNISEMLYVQDSMTRKSTSLSTWFSMTATF